MPASVEQLHPNIVAGIEAKLADEDRQLYRILYFSRVHPDDTDLARYTIVKCTIHLFAIDANEAISLFSNNVPDDYPVLIVVSVMPVSPDIPEDSMIKIERGPRRIN